MTRPPLRITHSAASRSVAAKETNVANRTTRRGLCMTAFDGLWAQYNLWAQSLSTASTDRKSTRLNSSHIPYLVCRLLLEKKYVGYPAHGGPRGTRSLRPRQPASART